MDETTDGHAQRVMGYLVRASVSPGTCPDCFSGRFYRLQTRANLKCADCGKHFSAYWWTPFFSHKLPVGDLLRLAEHRLIERLPMLQIARRMGVDYKTVWSFCKKLDILSDALVEDHKLKERAS